MNTTPTPTVDAPSAEDRVEAALTRITASRDAMRRVLMPRSEPAPRSNFADDGAPRSGWSRRFADGWQHWRHAMAEHPAVSMAMDAVHGWWKRQPLRPAVETAAGELRGVVAPLVRGHPLLAVSLAALLGAALVAGRPWRWPGLNQHFADAPQRAGRWLWAQLTQAPVQGLLASLFVAWAAARHPSAPGSSAAGPPPRDAPAPRAADLPAEQPAEPVPVAMT